MSLSIIVLLAAFLIVTVASFRLSDYFVKFGLPSISGLLIIGIIAGPYVLEMVPKEATNKLFFIGDISLAFIAFAAGNELRLKELRQRKHYIQWLTIGQLVFTYLILAGGVFLVSDLIPFFADFTLSTKIIFSGLISAVLCARSPASVIAVVNEMRARGPFTNTVMGTTVLMDFLVIVLFTITFAIATSLVEGEEFSIIVLVRLFAELLTSIGLGFLMSRILKFILSRHFAIQYKSLIVLAAGFASYLLYYWLNDWTKGQFGHAFHVEPLLICILGSFLLSNFTIYRQEFSTIIHRLSKNVYAIFFTYAGMLLAIDVIASVWEVALIIGTINAAALIGGTFLGGTIAKDEFKNSSLYWTAFLTQAGVGLGLATTVNNAFPIWGQEFAAIVISVIVINQLIGPPIFKWALTRRKESHLKADTPEFDGIRDVIIMGFETQSVALARQLMSHGWEVKLATRKTDLNPNDYQDLDIRIIEDHSLETLENLDARMAEAFVLMLTDQENLQLCEVIYENIGTKDVVVRLNNRFNFDKFHKLGALIVDPSTAIVSLMDHFVRSPQATSLLLGMQEGQDTIDLQVLNPELFGLTLRDMRLPNDVIILSIRRKGQMIISHGYTRLRKGDWVTMVGSNESLNKMTLLFDSAV